MNLLDYYPEISTSHTEYVTQQQMYEICGVCKSTVYKAERLGVVPYEKEVNHLVHTHKIKLTDALAFKYKREYGYRHDNEYIAALRHFYTRRLRIYPDVLTVPDVSAITGFVKNSVHRWVGRNYLIAFIKRRRFHIPKVSLIDFLISPAYNAIQDKSERQVETLREFEAWYAVKVGGIEI